jgi:DNA-binding NarL/FixJ family response regulator
MTSAPQIWESERPSPSSIMVVEDHTLVRQSLVKNINAQPNHHVAAEAADAETALPMALRVQPDVALIDIGLPGMDGLQLAERLKNLLPEIRIVFLSMYDDDVSIRRAVDIGADSYLPKTCSIEEVLQALDEVSRGGSYLAPAVARRVLRLAENRASAPPTWLTDRELEILSLLASGSRAGDVAKTLFLSLKTIKNHLTAIYSKLGVETASQAVAEAYRVGLVSQWSPSGQKGR